MPPHPPNISEDFRPADDSGIAVPSRALLLQFLADCRQPVTCKQIHAQFNLKLKAAEDALSGRLERMQRHGIVTKDRRGRYALPQKTDVVNGRVSGHANGYGFVMVDGDAEDLFLSPRQMHKVLHGDRVLARCKRIDERGRKEGVVIEVMIDRRREIVGHFHVENGASFVLPHDARYARDITIPSACRHGAEHGDMVVATIVRHPVEHPHAAGKIVEVLGKRRQPGMQTEIAIRKYAIPTDWPAEVSAQLKSMHRALQGVAPAPRRHDLRDLPLVTIDSEQAKDFDDAVYCEPRGDGWRLVVGIADVSHYVKPDTALDREACKRGNSVYFPTRVLPMLPPELANGICSLNPEQDRYCLVCDMHCNAAGEITRYQFYPALMRSQARLTYTIVHKIVEQREAELRHRWRQLAPHLDNLYAIYQLLAAQRRQRGSIDFEFPEADIQFDRQQKISCITRRQRNQAHRLIEECMLAANVCAARYVRQHLGNQTIYRNHAGPTDQAVLDLRRFIGGMGLTLDGGAQPKAADYARLMQSVAGKPELAPLLQTLLLRSLSQAVYGCEQHGHFALGYPSYTHFTSPIRRYSDLIVHRQIRQLLDRQAAPAPAPMPPQSELSKIAAQCSFTERRAEEASREVIAHLKAEFMQAKIGEQFDGVISGVQEFGLFVQLQELFVDGLIHITTLGDEYYRYDPPRFQLVGERSGRRFRLGDPLRVKLARVNLEHAKIDFELCADRAPPPTGKSTKRGKQKHRGNKTNQAGD